MRGKVLTISAVAIGCAVSMAIVVWGVSHGWWSGAGGGDGSQSSGISDTADSSGGSDSDGDGEISFGGLELSIEDDVAEGDAPMEVPSGWSLQGSYELSVGSAWTYEMTGEVGECASEVLELLEDKGASLEEAGYLGLGDSSWGCVADMQDGETAVMVTIIPEDRSISSEESADLVATVIVFDAESVSQSLE